jgi:diacylglycerol kinase family enzyme
MQSGAGATNSLATNSRQRVWSAAALLLTLAAVVLAVVVAVRAFPRAIAVLACLVAALLAAWWGVRRRGFGRTAGLVLAILLAAGALAIVIVQNGVLENLLVIAGILAGLTAARTAFRVHVVLPEAKRPLHPVLFYNPKSGGGKATRFHLANEARRRGIEAIELRPGEDLEQLVRDAIDGGADGLAMAGGDGSQAIVAMLAAEYDLPYACVPAGTRNHFALDLGVDRDDVVGALDAFINGGERLVDLAEVNERVFVNNVSLGLYADAVQQPGYRDAKLQTLLDTVPDVLGPGAAPPNLVWTGPNGPQSAVAILISNNQYRVGTALGSGTRPRLDTGKLGITVLAPIAPGANGGSPRRLSKQQWTTTAFEIQAEGPVSAGIDGEAVQLDPPLRFRIHPHALRVRIAPQHPGASPSALEPDKPWQVVPTLTGFVLHGIPTDLVESR